MTEPQRIKAWEGKGMTLWSCDDGLKHAWVELESTIDGTTTTVRLTREQARELESPIIDGQALPHLRGIWQFEADNQTALSPDRLASVVAAKKAERAEAERVKQPTLAELQEAKNRKQSRLATATAMVTEKQHAVDWTKRYKTMAKQLANDLSEARALDMGLDLTHMEAELAKYERYIAALPGQETALNLAKAELRNAEAWDGTNE
ncbi:hypothetical protein [Corynebacterium callunae]|uniref:Uncharacterized protein n=1 Tax=Corynebacterium callunae DSM 20147 TaxID=1121353 RepID=M1TV05_9CORY|nr:hypothetical protein [Corynebacterium callunae]AGG68026.1 hypothetical protein H924_13185 [Corynebacterium callunae DSM 20147]